MATWDSTDNNRVVNWAMLYELYGEDRIVSKQTVSQMTNLNIAYQNRNIPTKTDWLSYYEVNIDGTVASNQLPVKSDFTILRPTIDHKASLVSQSVFNSLTDSEKKVGFPSESVSWVESKTYGDFYNNNFDSVYGIYFSNADGELDTQESSFTIVVTLPNKWQLNTSQGTSGFSFLSEDTVAGFSYSDISVSSTYNSSTGYTTYNITVTKDLPIEYTLNLQTRRVSYWMFLHITFDFANHLCEDNISRGVLTDPYTLGDIETVFYIRYATNNNLTSVGGVYTHFYTNDVTVKVTYPDLVLTAPAGGSTLTHNSYYEYVVRVDLEDNFTNWSTYGELYIDLPTTVTFDSIVYTKNVYLTTNGGSNVTTSTLPNGKTRITHTATLNRSFPDPTPPILENYFMEVKFKIKASSPSSTAQFDISADFQYRCSLLTDSFTETIGASTTPVLVGASIYTCIGCVNIEYTYDSNSNSSTYLDYYLNGTYYSDSTNPPSNAPCNTTTPNYNTLVGTYCINTPTCANYSVYRNAPNNCFTGDQYWISLNGGTTFASDPSNGGCNFSATWGTYLGQICISCVTYDVYQNTNPCYTGNQYYSTNGQTWATNPTGTACNNDPIYGNYLGSYCVGCTQYYVWQNTNGCYTGAYQYYESVNTNPYGGTQLTSNPLTTGTPCNFSANWVDAGFNTCQSCTTYDVYIDNNSCSSTYGHYQVNGSYWGSIAPASGDCVTTPAYDNQGYYTCYNCTTYPVLRQTNPCAANYLDYFVSTGSGYVNLGSSAPSSDPCACCTTYYLSNNTGSYETVYYTNCAGTSTSITLNPYQGYVSICREDGTSWTVPTGVSTISAGNC